VRTATLKVVSDRAGAAISTETVITADKTWLIGRSNEADIVVDDERVSRRHLSIESAGPAWLIRDISSNGSWHAGVRVGPDGLTIAPTGEVRLNLGEQDGPEIVIVDDGRPDPAALATVPLPPRPAPNGEHRYEPVGPPALALVDNAAEGRQPNAGPTRKSRRGRRLGIVAVVVLLLLLVADRLAARAASAAAVRQVVQQSQGLTKKPSVSFGGFPFLTQVAFGKYTDINVGIDGITAAGGPRIQHISGHLKGAHIPLSKAIGGKVSRIPVDHVTATVVMSFTDLNAYLKNQEGHLHLTQSGDATHVSGTVDEGGTPVKVSGTVRVAVEDGDLTITPTALRVDGGDSVTDALPDIAGGILSLLPPVPVPLPNLPFNLRLTSIHTGNNSLQASAAADHLVLDGSQ
jgi:DUF2993 family protein/FHA domain-containing protein